MGGANYDAEWRNHRRCGGCFLSVAPSAKTQYKTYMPCAKV